MKNCFLILLCSFLLSSCASRPVVSDAVGEDAVNFTSMTCSKPYEFSQDCSIWGGAKKKVTIDDFDLKIAGSLKGDIVLVMGGNHTINALKEAATLNLGKSYRSESSNNSFEAVKKILKNNSVEIFRVRPVVSGHGVEGYILELDKDGYTLLKKYQS